MMSKKRDAFLIFQNKRGFTHEIFFHVFELVMAAIVLVALFYFINDIANQTIFERNFMARDLTLLLNTLYSAPGDVSYEYKASLADLNFDFAKNKVEISNIQGKESTKAFYPFAKNKNMQFQDRELVYNKEYVRIKFYKTSELVNVVKPDLSNVDSESAPSQTQTG